MRYACNLIVRVHVKSVLSAITVLLCSTCVYNDICHIEQTTDDITITG